MAQEFELFSGFEVCDAKARERITKLEEKNTNKFYIFIGDSYANEENEWVEHCASNLKITTDNYMKKAEGSTGFACANSSNKTFLSLLQEAYETIISTDTNTNKVTDIVVCGGANDNTYTVEQIKTAISEFMTYAKANFPNATVKIGAIGWTSDTTKIIEYAKVVRAYTESVNYGAEYLNNVQYVLHNYDLISSDGVHPTEEGYSILGSYIAQAIKTGSCNVIYNQRKMQNDTATMVVYESLNNNLVSIYSNGQRQVNAFDNISVRCNGNNAITLLENCFKYVKGSNFESARGFVTACFKCNGLPVMVPCNVGVKEGSLVVYPFLLETNSFAFKDLSNITDIVLPQFRIIIDSLQC